MVLKDYTTTLGDSERYDYYRRQYDALNPDWNKYRNALEALQRGDTALGAAFFKSAKPNKFEAEYHRISARLSRMRGNYDEALTQINKALQLRRYSNEYYWERGLIYMDMGQPQKYVNDLRRAYKLDTTAVVILDDLTFINSYLGNYDSSIYYGEKLLALDSSRAHIYYSVGISYISLKNLEQAESYNKLLLNLNSPDSTIMAMQKDLESAISRLRVELR